MNNRLVKVRWVDATHIEDDMAETKLISQKLAEFTTVGMVVVDNEQRLTIAGTVCHDEEETVYRDSLILPRQYIIEVKELGECDQVRSGLEQLSIR
jgi:hypothetical protein